MSEQQNTTSYFGKNVAKQTVFCFGELLLRMSPVLNRQWIHAGQMPVFIGGAELNVATALANWKVPATYCTALPPNYLSEEIMAELKEKNIGTEKIISSGERIGTYYLPQGADLKNAGVIYDRAYSSFWLLKTGQIDWDSLFEGCSWFHFSAISPALNREVAAVCLEAAKAARAKGLIVSIDLNYRAKLWKYGKKPVEIMPELVAQCDVVMGNIWSAAELLGTPLNQTLLADKTKTSLLKHSSETAAAIFDTFPNTHVVANTFRFDAGEGILYYAALETKQGQHVSNELSTDHVVDKIGSGDCFMGGLIYGLYESHTPEQVINYAAAAAFGKLQEKSDATSQTVENVNEIMKKYGTAALYH